MLCHGLELERMASSCKTGLVFITRHDDDHCADSFFEDEFGSGVLMPGQTFRTRSIPQAYTLQ